MANFNTHFSVALVISTGAAIAAANAQVINNGDIAWFSFLGTLGGLLPDIDASNSKPVKLLFFVLALMSVAAVMDTLKNSYAPYPLLLIMAVTYILIRYIALALFNKLTVHRGVFHSILAAIFFALLTTCVGYRLLQWEVLYSWLSGIFVAMGFIVHLVLDEIYSVNLLNTKIKKSFGTALKAYSSNSMTASVLMTICVLMLYSMTPSFLPLATALKEIQVDSVFNSGRHIKPIVC